LSFDAFALWTALLPLVARANDLFLHCCTAQEHVRRCDALTLLTAFCLWLPGPMIVFLTCTVLRRQMCVNATRLFCGLPFASVCQGQELLSNVYCTAQEHVHLAYLVLLLY